MRVVVISDAHIDGGVKLGEQDPEWVHTRIIDARRVLMDACKTPCDVLVFLGDVCTGPDPHLVALSVMQEALNSSPADAIALVFGNHDHGGWARSCLDVIGAGLRHTTTHIFHTPGIVTLNGLQVAALPWTPPGTFYPQTDTPKDAHRLVASALHDIARGLASQVDAARPSMLGAHWMLAGSELASGEDVMTAREPVLSVAELEASGPWGAIVAGHNHKGQRVGDRSWVCGSLMRDSFGEEHITPGYLIIDFDGPTATVQRIATPDRPLRTVTLDPDALLSGGDLKLPDVTDAIVKLRGKRTEQQERDMIAANADAIAVDRVRMAGAARVSDPDWETERPRRVRSDIATDANPVDALRVWLEQQKIPDDIGKRVLDVAPTLMKTTTS